MSENPDFATQIRTRFPEGLTGIFTIGATRRTYILEHQRGQTDNLGQIDDFAEMGAFLLDRYLAFSENFFALGGQNMIITILSYRSFFERGSQYADKVTPEILRLINETSLSFYEEQGVDPYFIGLEPLLHQSPDTSQHQVARTLHDFMAKWPYQVNRRKILWEVASIPLFTFWQVITQMEAAQRQQIQEHLNKLTDLPAIQNELYQVFSQAAFGTPLPMPHFYLGNNMSGDLKWRAPMPLALTGGEYLRAYYTPYPLLFLTRESFRHILDDLAFGKRHHAPTAYDYSGHYSAELIDAEYQRIQVLAADPETTLGLIRKIPVS